MFYKQQVLVDFWGRKDSAVGKHKLWMVTIYHSFHVHGAVTRAPMHSPLAQIGALFASQKESKYNIRET